MNDLEFREAYWDDRDARRAFQRFLVEIHGLDLRAWEAAGYWNDGYRPFSFFDAAGRVVSSVCVYSLEMVVNGSGRRAAQVSGVGTLPERRRRGLNRRLTERALEWSSAAHDFVFLFADEDAAPFYDRCGFLPHDEHAPYVRVAAQEPRRGMRALDLDLPSDRDRLLDRVARRSAVSDRLGVLDRNLFMFHALYTLSGLLHEIPGLDVVVALRREGRRTTVLDLVGPRVPRFDELYPYIAAGDSTEVGFRFVPDKLAITDLSWQPLQTNHLHVRAGFPLSDSRFLFPFTAHA